jgi:hypothetical protein
VDWCSDRSGPSQFKTAMRTVSWQTTSLVTKRSGIQIPTWQDAAGRRDRPRRWAPVGPRTPQRSLDAFPMRPSVSTATVGRTVSGRPPTPAANSEKLRPFSHIRWFYGRYSRNPKTLAHLLRAGMLPEAWAAPLEVGEARPLVRMRTSLDRMRSRIRARVHAVLAEHGVATPMSDLFGKEGRRLLEELHLPELSQGRLEACL